MISIFDPTNGRILRSTTAPVANDQHWVEGFWPNDAYHIVNGQVEPLPARPDTTIPSRFDHDTQQWKIDTIILARQQRRRRNDQLMIIDRVNPVWFSTLDDQQKTQLQVYRQALLDVPQQSGFPETVDWPSKPAWL